MGSSYYPRSTGKKNKREGTELFHQYLGEKSLKPRLPNPHKAVKKPETDCMNVTLLYHVSCRKGRKTMEVRENDKNQR